MIRFHSILVIKQAVALYFACEMTVCVLYAVAGVVILQELMKAPARIGNKVHRRRIVAYVFCCMSVFYFMHVFIAFLSSHTIPEESYFNRILLLHLAVFPILLHLPFADPENQGSFKKCCTFMLASFCCLLVSLCTGEVVGMSLFDTLGLRTLGGVICLGQLSVYVCLFCRKKIRKEQIKERDRQTKIFAFLGVGMSVAAFPLCWRVRSTPYWLALQLCVWAIHFLLFRHIFSKEMVTTFEYEIPNRQPGLLADESEAYLALTSELADDELYQRIISYFESDKPYLKAGVNVADIAAVLFTNKTYVSRLLNDKLNQNFPQFINAYRIKEAQRLVMEEGPIPLSKLCKKVGFTSMATFTVAFRVNTGMTPGEWCRKQKQIH